MGLRERKKERTRADLQRHALRLVRERGWAATTVDDIAAAAEVSRSTFFRYFPTKEDVVLFDDVDPLLEAAFAAQAPGTPVLEAVRDTVARAFGELDEEKRALEEVRMGLARTVPEVAAAVRERQSAGFDMVVRALAGAIGHDERDPDVIVLAGVVNGARQAAAVLVARGVHDSYVVALEHTLGRLTAGIPLADAPVVAHRPDVPWPWGPARDDA